MEQKWLDDFTAELQKISSSRDETRIEKPQLRPGERRAVAVLFLDLKGFTAISEKMDPEELHKIIDQCFKIFTRDIEKFGGYLDKYEGDRIMALFGAKKSSEFDSELAIKAGLLMQSHLEEINSVLKKREIALEMRIGINFGAVVAAPVGKERPGDFTVYGDAVNLASRLESNAPVGKILISEDVYKQVKGNFKCTALGAIQIKGKSQPVSVYTVEEPSERAIQRWERSLLCQRAPFVNRVKEQEQIKDYFQALCSRSTGSPEVLLIQGMPGIGKSRLLYECVQACFGSRNHRMLFQARCIPYGPSYHSLLNFILQGIEFIRQKTGKNDVKQILEELTQELDGKDKEFYQQGLPFLLNLLGIQKYPDSELDSRELQLKIFLAIKLFFQGLFNFAQSTKTSFQFIFDDVQWMDTASREALIFLLDQMVFKSLPGIIFISRDDFDFSQFLPRTLKSLIIRLSPLAKQDCQELIEKTIGARVLPDQLLDNILSLCQGNPYFLEEILICFQNRNYLVQKQEKWEWQGASAQVPLPTTIESLLLSRIDCLPKQLKETIQLASVLGKSFDRKILFNLLQKLGKETEELDNHLNLLSRLGLIHQPANEPYQFSFNQNLLQQVVYNSLLIENRKILHQLSADAFQEVYPKENQAFSIAHHYLNSAHPDKALPHLLLAVQQWVRDFRCQEALPLLNQGLDLLKDKPLSPEQSNYQWQLLVEKEKIAELTNDQQTRAQVLEQVQNLAQTENHPAKLALSKTLTSWFEINLGKYEQAIRTAQQILQIPEIKETSIYADALHYLGLAHYNLGDYDQAKNYLNQTLTLRKKLKDPDGEAWALSSFSTILWRYGEYDDAIQLLEHALKIRQNQNYLRGMAHNLNNLGLVYFSIGNFNLGKTCFHNALELYQQIGDVRNQGNVLSNLSILFLYQEQLKPALDYAQKALELSQKYGLFRLNINARIYLAKILLELKDPAGFEEISLLLESALKDAQASSYKQAILEAKTSQASLLLTKSQLQPAYQLSSEAIALMKEMGLVEEELCWLHSHLAILLKKESEALNTLKSALDSIKTSGQKIQDKQTQKSFIYSNPYRKRIMELAKKIGIISP